jgi:DNA anti-recombination protein RmuC
MGAALRYPGTSTSLISTLAAGAAGLLTLVAAKSPAAAMVVGTAVEKAVGSIQTGIVNTDIKNSVGQEYAKWLRKNAKAQSEKAAEAVGKQFDELEATLGQAITFHINSIHEQVESIRAAKEKGQDEANRLAEELTSVGQRLDEIDDRLDTLIGRVEQV